MGLRIVMFGAPGAGKGTQAAETAKKYGIVHISTGEIFRKNLREGDIRISLNRPIIAKGETMITAQP